jgi:CHAT domain-containing protein
MSSRSDPDRPLYVHGLGAKQFRRYILSKQRVDLDNSIARFTESILLLPHSWLQHGSYIFGGLFSLALALSLRSKAFTQPEDAIYATKYLFHLRDQPHECPYTSRHKVTATLANALALQVELEAGNVMQNIREMVVLSRELLTLDTSYLASDVNVTSHITHLCGVLKSKIRPEVPDQPLDEVIEFLRAARKHTPDLLDGRVALAMSLVARYFMTCVDDDYEEAALILDEIITYRSPENSQDESVADAQGFATYIATTLAMLRATAYESPEYLEEAIRRTSTCSSSSSFKKLYSPFGVVLDPAATAKERLRYFGSVEGAKESSGHSMLSQLDPLLPKSSQAEDSSRHPVLSQLDPLFTKSIPGIEMRDLLFEIRKNDDTTKIHEAIERGRSILASSPNATTHALNFFSEILLDAFFFHTENIKYLNESISIRRQVIESTRFQLERFNTLSYLSLSLLARSQFFPGYRTQDLDEGLQLLSQCVNTPHTSLPDRFLRACAWAFLARGYRHPSVSTAHETALSLMQDIPLFSPTLQLQHVTLAMGSDSIITQGFPLDYASYHVDHHQLEEAIETLERGRALLWSEMRYLRIPIDQLLKADPDLGHKFAAVNRDLEELTKSVPPSHKLSMDDNGSTEGLGAVDPFGRLLLKQRVLLKERAKLISKIQSLPGFDTFLASPSFKTLRSAASSGPVIIINYSKWRSDILVLLHDMPPSLIPTPDDFFERAGALKDKLLNSREKYGLDSNDYDEALASVLAELYTLVGKPVIDRLRRLQVPEQSRVWWYPTSVFCSLPLHAMGPIPSDDGEPRYFLDLYICSYTPTLSALIQSRRRDAGSRSLDRPAILLVAQPDPSLPTVGGEIQAVQALGTEVISLISEAATPATVIDGFHHHKFVHFACHGTLKTGKPFEAGFEFDGHERLTLLEIVRSHLPTAEFAFLSACHTAEMTEGSIIDEGLHLAAAVQYSGFRSVVGTMWAMVDEDGQDLAENFYKALFSNSRRDQGIPYHERSAKALRSAVKKLRRKKRITLERWVNFVHYGA